jgi:GNAT superfamily N-acetyltransferase
MLRLLRSFGPLEALMMEGAPGFVWAEDGRVLGNASIQRNPTRRDTWVVGNVATHPDFRNRGIGTSLMSTVIHYARMRGARHVALQVLEGNTAALRVYEKLGFRTVGAVAYYQRPAVRIQPVWHDVSAAPSVRVRRASWKDSDDVWQATRDNLPEELTYAEPFDRQVYRLGLRWSLANMLRGNAEQWLVAEDDGVFTGAVRTRVNFELSQHHVELMLPEQATTGHGIRLLGHALQRFEIYISKPLLAIQSRPHEPSHTALAAMGFRPTRTLLHMVLGIS